MSVRCNLRRSSSILGEEDPRFRGETNRIGIPSPTKHDLRSPPVGGTPNALSSHVVTNNLEQLDIRNYLQRLFFRFTHGPPRKVPLIAVQHKSGEATDCHSGRKSPSDHQGRGTYSIFFTVPKWNGDWRLILDLKFVNRFLHLCCFHMEPLWTITVLFNPRSS